MRSARSTFVLLLLAVLLCALVGAASAGAASQAQINASIISGVNYLVPLQSTGSGTPAGAWPCDEYYAANTGIPRDRGLAGLVPDAATLAVAAAPLEVRLTLLIESLPAKVPELMLNSVPVKLNVSP